jgi:O-antigen/teichoic acid export membrane protein
MPRPGGIVRNTAFALATQVATSAFTAALTLFLVRALSPHDFGRFTLALALAGIVTLPADLGLSSSAARFIAERRSDREQSAALFAQALWAKAAVAGTVAILLFAFAGPIASGFGDHGLAWPLRGTAVALFGQSLLMLVLQTFVSLQRVSSNLVAVVGESAFETTAPIALVLAGTGATGAAFGRAIGYTAGIAIGLVLVARRLGPAALRPRALHHIGEIGRYARSLAVVDWSFAAFEQIDQLLIGVLLTTRAVATFGAPLRLAVFLHYPGYAVANGVVPRLARTENSEPDARSFAHALRLLFVVQTAITVPLLVWAQPLTALLLGKGYGNADDVLRALAPYVFLSGLAPLVSLGANYLGEARRRPRIALATLGVNLLIDLLLLRRYGVVVAAVATDIAFFLYVPAHFVLCARTLRLDLRPLATGLVRSLLAGAAAAACLAALGTSHISVAHWIVGSIAAVAAFAAVLVVTGELRALYPSGKPAGTVAVEP